MSPLARLLTLLVRGYRLQVSPLLPPRCRFAPSCSAYALEALRVHGAVRGGGLVVVRLAKCQPFHPGGHDPVPPPRPRRAQRRQERPAPPGDAGSMGAGPRTGLSGTAAGVADRRSAVPTLDRRPPAPRLGATL